jgi:hypothetical protein
MSKTEWKNTTERSSCGDFFIRRRLGLDQVIFEIYLCAQKLKQNTGSY